MRCSTVLASLVLSVVFACSAATAQPLTTAFTFQGELDSAGSPLTGTYDFRFLLFDNISIGTQLGSAQCADNVAVANGRFTVQLDFGSQFAGLQRFLEVWVRQDSGLDCASNTGFTILGPRQSLTAAPNAAYALSAGAAATATTATNTTQLNGQPASFYQNAANLSAGTIPDARIGGAYSAQLNLSNAGNLFTGSFTGGGAGLTGLNASNMASGTLSAARLPVPLVMSASVSSSDLLQVTNSTGPAINGLASGNFAGVEGFAQGVAGYGVFGRATSATGANRGGWFQSLSSSGIGVEGDATSATGIASGVFGQSVSTSGYGVFGSATSSSGVTMGGRFVAGSANGYGVYGYNGSTSGEAVGVLGQTASSAGIGVKGIGSTAGVYGATSSDNGAGVHGLAGSSYGFGVTGEHTATTGAGAGVAGYSESDGGTGVIGRADADSGYSDGGFFTTRSNGGVGVLGLADASAGTTYGGYFSSLSTSGYGVFGGVSATSGNTYAVYGDSESTSGIGAVGSATATGGPTYGVYGQSFSAQGIGSYGRNASASGGGYGVVGQAGNSGYALFANGSTGATGTKSFRIDDPADPLNKYIIHYCSESPMPQNFYVGNVVTDDNGYAWVELPAYFQEINANFKYQLTVIDDADSDAFVIAKVSKKIEGNRFQIRTSLPHTEVSWEVKADRNDPYVRQSKPRDVVAKKGSEQGKYQSPELYGKPPEMGLMYRQPAAAPAPLPIAANRPGGR